MTAPYRVIVTGSRYLPDVEPVVTALENILNGLAPGQTLIVVTGGCRTGADAYASIWAYRVARHLEWPVTEETHPADWSRGKQAGPERNQRMVDLGADLCLAFPLGASRGTRDCMRRANAAGIPVKEWTA
jgi:hypothetical protein